jgi:hypothetical protein
VSGILTTLLLLQPRANSPLSGASLNQRELESVQAALKAKFWHTRKFTTDERSELWWFLPGMCSHEDLCVFGLV